VASQLLASGVMLSSIELVRWLVSYRELLSGLKMENIFLRNEYRKVNKSFPNTLRHEGFPPWN
jgi:hypothetical protein